MNTSCCNVAEALFEQARRRPTAPALILHDRILRFHDMAGMAHHLAATLLGAGVKPRQMVGISMTQTPLHLMTLLALAQIGAVSFPVHPMLSKERRHLAAARFGAEWIVSGREEMRLDGLPFLNLVSAGVGGKQAAPIPVAEVDAEAPFRIALSSGTSGDPKGMMFTHGYMLDRMAKSNYACIPLSRLMTMDINFAMGFVFAIGMLSVGGAVIFPASNKPIDAIKAAAGHAATHWLISPAQARQVAVLLTEDGTHFPTLEHLRIVGSTPDAKLLNVLRTRFSPNVFVPYGSTEMGPVSIATPEILDTHPDSCGRLFPWAHAEVVDDRDQPLPRGTNGRLRLRSEGMLADYYRDPARTAERFRDGWYYPGDIGRIDGDGLLFIEGREDDVLNIEGSKVLVGDVESVLLEHPSVDEAAAFVLGEGSGRAFLAAAAIVSAPTSVDELMDFALQRLGPLRPRRIFIVGHFPRNANGKLLRQQLASEIEKTLAAPTSHAH